MTLSTFNIYNMKRITRRPLPYPDISMPIIIKKIKKTAILKIFYSSIKISPSYFVKRFLSLFINAFLSLFNNKIENKIVIEKSRSFKFLRLGGSFWKEKKELNYAIKTT